MDEDVAYRLCELNREFYRRNAASFSATRHASWPGWLRCLAEMGLGGDMAGEASCAKAAVDGSAVGESAPAGKQVVDNVAPALRVLDVGCGNLRFEEFLARELPASALSVVAVDNCAQLVPDRCAGTAVAKPPYDATALCPDGPDRVRVWFAQRDVISGLARGDAVLPEKVHGHFDVAVAFGFMHHIPLRQWRYALIDALVAATRPGGFVAVSLWRFMDDVDLARKARVTHERGVLALGLSPERFDAGDYLLGWRDEEAYRFCHSFVDEDVDDLVRHASPRASLVARFRADGRTGDLNEYLVLRVR